MACLIWYGGGDDGSQVEDGDVDHGDVNSVGVTVDEDDCNDVAAAVVIILAQTVPKSGCDSEEYPGIPPLKGGFPRGVARAQC